MKWELKEDTAAYKFLKLNCKPELFQKRLTWLELKAENELKKEGEWFSTEISIVPEESVSGYGFSVRAHRKDFR